MWESHKCVKCLDDCNVGPHNCKWPWPCLLNDPELQYNKEKVENKEN